MELPTTLSLSLPLEEEEEETDNDNPELSSSSSSAEEEEVEVLHFAELLEVVVLVQLEIGGNDLLHILFWQIQLQIVGM